MLSVAAFQLHSIMPYTASTRRIAIVFVVFATTRDESFPKNRTAHSSEARVSACLCPCLWARGYRSPTSCQRQRQPRPHRVRRHTALVAGATAKGERLRGWADHRRPGAGRRRAAPGGQRFSEETELPPPHQSQSSNSDLSDRRRPWWRTPCHIRQLRLVH